MAISFDDEHLNRSDKSKHSNNVKYNGGVEKGVSAKWEKAHQTKDTYNTAGGASMSRKMGTGELGREQTIPGEVLDTSAMSPEDKFRYMNALGLLGDKQEQPKPTGGYKMNNNRPVRRSSVQK